MFDISPEVATLLMFGGVIVGVFVGFPMAFAVGGTGLIVGLLILGNPTIPILYSRTFALTTNYTLVAAPLFVFMGIMLERSRIADTMYHVLYILLGGLRGGLAIVTILMGTILAATVGIIGASISMLALVALPAMIARGYDRALASGSVVAGGCLGILIPPSIMLVIYGPMASVSVGKLFMAAIFPGLLLSSLYCIYIFVICRVRPNLASVVPPEERAIPMTAKISMLLKSLVPPAVLIFAVLGVIFLGIAPPTEAAGIGALVATILAAIYRQFSLKMLSEVALDTLRLASMILLIGALSFAFVGVFLSMGCGEVVERTILAMPGGRWGSFLAVMFAIFLLGFFIDWIGILFIIIPIVSPMAILLEFDPLWFGMMICVNLQMAFMTPPLAQGIFFLKGAADPKLGIDVDHIIRGVLPFIGIVIIVLGVCIIFPQLITWLPGQMIR